MTVGTGTVPPEQAASASSADAPVTPLSTVDETRPAGPDVADSTIAQPGADGSTGEQPAE
jgi:hypothetical protein